MKKALCLALALIMVFSLAACGGGKTDTPASNPPASDAPASNPPATDAPTTDTPPAEGGNTAWNPDNIGEHTFILAHGLAETSQTGTQYHEFALAVEELSGGKMKVEERIAGSLVTDTETLDAIMDGTVDFAHSMVAYVSGTIRDIAPLSIAGYYGGDDWLSFADRTHGVLSDIYGEFGIKYLGPVYQGNSLIICTEKQITEPADVKGLTFRASGTWISKSVQAWGGAATTIGLADLADSFSKKTVQGTATGLNIVVPFKLYDVAEYITFTTMSESFGSLIMSGDTYDKLNADEQALIEEAGKVFTQRSYEVGTEFATRYLEEIETAGKNEIYTLSAEEQQQFIDLAFALYPEMEAEVGEKGKELIDLLKEINGVS